MSSTSSYSPYRLPPVEKNNRDISFLNAKNVTFNKFAPKNISFNSYLSNDQFLIY